MEKEKRKMLCCFSIILVITILFLVGILGGFMLTRLVERRIEINQANPFTPRLNPINLNLSP